MGGIQSIVFNAPRRHGRRRRRRPRAGRLLHADDRGRTGTAPPACRPARTSTTSPRACPARCGRRATPASGSPRTRAATGSRSPTASRPGETTLRVAFVDGQHLYASTSSTVYRTDDGGLTWEEADGADDQLLPAGGKRAFLMTPTLNGQFGDNRGIVGTEGGPWVTVDKGDHWLPMSDSTAPRPLPTTRDPERAQPRHLVARPRLHASPASGRQRLRRLPPAAVAGGRRQRHDRPGQRPEARQRAQGDRQRRSRAPSPTSSSTSGSAARAAATSPARRPTADRGRDGADVRDPAGRRRQDDRPLRGRGARDQPRAARTSSTTRTSNPTTPASRQRAGADAAADARLAPTSRS